MGFFTSLNYYRPLSPPRLTAHDLGQFVAAVDATGSLTSTGLHILNVAFGDAIDGDDFGTTWVEETEPGVGVMHDIEWDLERFDCQTAADMVDLLANDTRRIYRAQLMLGTPTDAILKTITRQNSPENEHDFTPDTMAIEIGRVETYAMDVDPWHVGWISLGFSGYGYLYPWTFRDTVARIESACEFRQLMDVCRATWPVVASPPAPNEIEARRSLGKLWPYDQLDKPWDWYWGLRESG
jgi:hypothetical protein